MSRYELITTIHMELERLNSEIDLKIIKGSVYRKESQRHRFLKARLAELARKERSSGFFTRAAHAMSMFVL